MKKWIFLSLLFPVLALAQTSSDPALSDAVYLRKLSFHLRGIKPAMSEYTNLSQASDKGAFFQSTIKSYLSSPQAQDRMVYRLSERFQVLPPDMDLSVYTPNKPEAFKYTQAKAFRVDSMTDLFRRMAKENLSWDQLLTAKSYNLYPKADTGGYGSDYEFFSPLKPDLPSDPIDYSPYVSPAMMTPINLQFSPDDARVSGVLTTARFLNRYTTTNVNRNRRRAAAVFRIFLCDPMFPIIPPPPDKKAAALGHSFQDDVHAGLSESELMQGMTITDAQRHGADKNCAACHYKLDPMGVTFQNFGLGASTTPSPGWLTYSRKDGSNVRIPLRGIGDLGRAVVAQPEYVSCQIDWFWKQYIGKDIALTSDRKAQLMQEFERVGRRTNDFIQILVSSTEFRSRAVVSDAVTFDRVSPLLKRCDSCHNDSETFNGDAFIGPTPVSARFLEDADRYVNMPDNSRRKMPQDWKKWDSKDLELVKRWLNEGAVDKNGHPQKAVKAQAGKQ